MALGTDGVAQEHLLNAHGWDFDLRAVTMPVHIIQGELDNVSDPEGSRKLQAALADGHYHAFAELGQYLLFTEWPWILEACASRDAMTSNALEVLAYFQTITSERERTEMTRNADLD